MQDVGLLEPETDAENTSGGSGSDSDRRRKNKNGKDGGPPPLPPPPPQPSPAAESIWSSVSSAATKSVRGLVDLATGGGDEGGAEGRGDRGDASSEEGEEGRGVEPLGGGGGSEREEQEGERLHVFSLATGHLYERFLKVRLSELSE